MQTLTSGIRYLDLNYLGRPQVIATAVFTGPDGVTLVDPGPTSSLAALRDGLGAAGLALQDVRTLLLTHIHLDHAGATGTIVREQPAVQVYVHERGAPHLVDPTRLLDSATRLYGSEHMERLWGAVLPVPAENVHALRGGEQVNVAGRRLDVGYTPGHASHHVAYFDADSGIALSGDVAGIRIGSGFVIPPTPPPDIDLEAWRASVDRILAWRPATLFLTHFGPSESPATHMAALLESLERQAALVRTLLASGRSEAEQIQAFSGELLREARRRLTDAEVRSYELAVPFEHCYLGLARYWKKRGV